MDPLQRFAEYAAEFEKTYEDDDWSRLEQYFHPDATYVIKGSPSDCELKGRDAILAGMKKSLDGFDRRFDKREIAPGGEPKIGERSIAFSGIVSYEKDGAEPLSFSLVETAEFNDAGQIVRLQDDYPPGQEHLNEWLANNPGFDASYV